MQTMDWTSPSSYATASTTLDSLVATVATRHLHEAFVEVAVLLELAREARGPIAVRDRIERSVEAMTAYVAVHDELSRLRRGDRSLPVVATLEAVCEAHRGVPGVEGGVRFEAADATVKALAEPAAVWVASVALGEMVRELSRRG